MNLLPIIGAQDIYLTGHPQISYFENIYRTHTHFTKDENIIYNDNICNCEKTFVIKHECDLLNGINLIIDLQENVNYKNNVDSYIVEYAEIYFDDFCIQKITNDFINITNKLLYKKSNTKRIGNKIFINLPFWFTEITNALPLVALKNKVTLKIKFNLLNNIKNLQVITNRIFLDNEERKKIAYSQNKYLFANIYIVDSDIDKKYNTEYLLWLKQPNNMIDFYFVFDNQENNNNNYFNYQDISLKTKISLGDKVISNHDKLYYTHYMQNKYENNCDNTYVYSYSLNPTRAHNQSFGYCENLIGDLKIINNFDKINGKYKIKLLIRYYNVLHIDNSDYKLENKFDNIKLNIFYNNNDVEIPDVITI